MQNRNLVVSIANCDLDFNIAQMEELIAQQMNSGDVDDNADIGDRDDSKDDGDKNSNDPKADNFSRSRKSFCC
ncbi:MAG: hypothetical protein IPK14_05215 [Blastocatellia bacterium]|nr:hypothetical protein [Blastocatellia bacterium]